MEMVMCRFYHGIFCLALLCAACGGMQSEQNTSTAIRMPTIPASVVMLADAPQAAPSSAKARIRHLARGQNAYLGHLWVAPGAGVPLQRDPTEEYLYILEGGGLLIMEGQEYQLVPGHAVYMPAMAQVQFKNGDAPTVLLQVFAGPQSADKYDRWESKPTQN